MNNAVIILILLLTLFNGHIHMFKFYIRWNSLVKLLLVKDLRTGHPIKDWIWIGSRDRYRAYLDEENARLAQIVKDIKAKNNG